MPPELFGLASGAYPLDGRNGWTDDACQLVAIVRHTVNLGQNKLLVDAEWLEEWLTNEQKSLI